MDVFEKYEEDTLYTPELAKKMRDFGYWGDMGWSDYLDWNANERGNEFAIVDDDRKITWEQLRDEADAFAAGLRQTGLQEGDRVLFQLPNQIEWFVVRLGIVRAGCVGVPLIYRFREHELTHIASTADPVAYVTTYYRDYEHPETGVKLQSKLEHLEHVIVLGDGVPTGAIPYDEISDQDARGFSPSRIPPDYPTALGTTSGTTGLPKLYYNHQNRRITTAKDLIGRYSVTSYDDVLVLAPIQHAVGEVWAYFIPMVSGATTVISRATSPEAQWQTIQDTEPSFVVSIPTQMNRMMERDPDATLEFIRTYIASGTALPPETAEYFESKGTVIGLHYGAADGGLPNATAPADSRDVRYETVGKPVQSMEVKVIDDDGKECPTGEIGEVIWRGGNQCLGYFDDQEATEKMYDIGGEWHWWVHSGDVGAIDEQGNLSLYGRRDDMIIRGGQNIYPSQIESVLVEHEAIDEVAIIGMPDSEYGERACAYVVSAGDAHPTLEELSELLLEEGFAKYKLPERLELVTQLPRSESGSIKRPELEEDIEAKLANE